MFKNKYIMNSKRYTKWTVPKFYALPIFYIYVFIAIFSCVAYWYFKKYGMMVNFQWKNIAVLLVIIAIYRGVFANWLRANKHYRLMKQKYFDDRPWECLIEIDDKLIKLYLNGKSNNEVSWDKIKEIRIAKTFIKLKTDVHTENVMLDKNGFVDGNDMAFMDFIKKHKPQIPILEEEFKYNC